MERAGSVRDFLETARARRWSRGLEQAIFSTTESGPIATSVTAAVSQELGDVPIEALFYEVSTALVLGLRLESGAAVVVKVFQPACEWRYLVAVRKVQAALARAGYPAPAPLAGPFRMGNSHAVVDALIDSPPYSDRVGPTDRRVLAQGLARFIRGCGEFPADADLRRPPFPFPPTGLWGVRFRPELDLNARRRGARWIDDFGRRGLALARSGHGREVIGHADWGPHNVRVRDGQIAAVFDWDSVCVAAEPIFVGKAIHWGPVDDAVEFVDHYEAERGSRLGVAERRMVFGVATWWWALVARWEHCQRIPETGFRDNLRLGGERLLNLAEPRRSGRRRS
jgi:hypothetical protein